MGDVRPTAKWANRMLRPLTSIYDRIEKHQENLSILANAKSLKERTEVPANTSRSSSKAASSNGAAEEGRGGSFSDDEHDDDPVWIPGKPEKRRIRHNYSNRGQRNRGHKRRSRLSIRSPEVQKTLPGAIEIATPLITGEKTRGLSEGSLARRRLFRDASPPLTDGSEVDDGRKTIRNSWGKSCYAPYNGSWREALDQSGDPGLVDIARLLDRLFVKFLHNTRLHATSLSQQKQQGRGARSLLSMTVRRLPEFIAEEQDAQDEEDEDADEDMCDAYFTELEAHYAPSGNGWQPLREAVRAQGIYLVSEILQKKCITRRIACRLLEECMNNHEQDAFELLLSKFLCTVDDMYDYPTAFDDRNDCRDPVQLLGTYYSRFPCRRSFVFEELARLLGRRVLPPEWMVTTQWKRFVDMAIQSLSIEEDDSAAATRLIETVILSAGSVYPGMDDMTTTTTRVSSKNAACPRGRDTRASISNATEGLRDKSSCPVPIQDALSNLTLSLVTALCGMHLARSRTPAAAEGRGGVGMRVRTVMGHLAFTVEQVIEMRPSSHESDVHSLRRGCALLGDCLLRCGERDSSETDYCIRKVSNIGAFYVSLASRQDVVKELAILARQVFRCCERVHRGNDQPGTASEVRTKVVQLVECSSERSLSTFLGKVAAETAMQLAEITLDPDDHVWAVEIQERILDRQQQQQQQPASKTFLAHGHLDDFEDSPGLYRWEESIEEWVARTPVTKPKIKPVDQQIKAVGASAVNSPSSCSSSSSSRVSASPASSASSLTSSVPSLPAKRACPGREGRGARSTKRLRSARKSWGMSESECESDSEDDRSQSRAIPATPATPAASEDDREDWQDRGPQTRRRKQQMQEQMQSRPKISESEKGRDSHEAVGGAGSNQIIAVVITNKKPPTPSMLPSPPRTRSLSRRKSMGATAAAATLTATSNDDRTSSAVDRQRARTGGWTTTFSIPASTSGSQKKRVSMPTIIPRRRTRRMENPMDSGSDDELSFL